jgi:hypothetical protein
MTIRMNRQIKNQKPNEPEVINCRKCPIIFSRLIGGLGNQMFQYAAAFALAKQENAKLVLDIEDFKKYNLRHYLLGRLNVKEPIAQPGAVRPFRVALRFGRLGQLLLRQTGWLMLIERSFPWKPLNLGGAKHVWMSGFWQSWRYSLPVLTELREIFTPQATTRGLNTILLKEIRRSTSICLHVRRGDYVSNPNTKAIYEILNPSYYRAALRLLKIKGATAYVFSDDPSWARQHLKLGLQTRFVDHNPPEKPEEDLRLMSACRHFVIANSSLSWWAAWLGIHRNKRVIAPARWFAGANHDTRDLLPQEWEKL